jgi:preprotein translocase subunit SecA
VTDAADLVAGDPDVVVIDEADSVLIDEARVPLVLAGAAEIADIDREMARIAAELTAVSTTRSTKTAATSL